MLTNFVNEPQSSILSESRGHALNLVAAESNSARTTITDITKHEKPQNVIDELKRIKTLNLPSHHYLNTQDINPDSLTRIIISAYDRHLEDFQQLIGLEGVGPKTIRALALISELVYGVTPSYQDPACYSFAYGGKDGIPYPVDRETYDQSTVLLSKAIHKTKLGIREKNDAVNRLTNIMNSKLSHTLKR